VLACACHERGEGGRGGGGGGQGEGEGETPSAAVDRERPLARENAAGIRVSGPPAAAPAGDGDSFTTLQCILYIQYMCAIMWSQARPCADTDTS
jgi:hypothetical protein